MTTEAATSEGGKPPPERVLTSATLPLYLGGFLGPFGTMVVISIYPELRDTFDASTAAVNWSFSAYLIPFALLLLVSGTLGERWGRRRVTRTTYLVYAAATVVCIAAPTLGLFVAARALQGVANAFVTPMLLAGLTEVIAPRRLGRAIGVFSSFQAAGTALAPFVAGLLARANWRLVFVVVAVVALLLASRPPEGDPRPAAAAPPIRPLLTVQMGLLWIASFAAAAGPLGAAVIVGLFLRDELDVGSAAGGAVLFLGGFASMLLGPTWGRLLDQWGAVKASAVSCLALSALVAPLGYFASAGWFAVMWTIAGGFTGFLVINLQNLSAVAVPDNRGGALSSVMSFRFFGHAVGPLLWVPVFDRSPEAAFVGVGALGLLALVTLVGAAVRITAVGASDAPTTVS